MNKFFHKIKAWFKPKPKRAAKPKIVKTQVVNYQPINYRHYRKFIGKIASRAIAIQRARQRRM